jgi:hypothetical protein
VALDETTDADSEWGGVRYRRDRKREDQKRTTSDGIRSGVNWIRENSMSRT